MTNSKFLVKHVWTSLLALWSLFPVEKIINTNEDVPTSYFFLTFTFKVTFRENIVQSRTEMFICQSNQINMGL